MVKKTDKRKVFKCKCGIEMSMETENKKEKCMGCSKLVRADEE